MFLTSVSESGSGSGLQSGLCLEAVKGLTEHRACWCPVSPFFGDDDSKQMKVLDSRQQRRHNNIPIKFYYSYNVLPLTGSCRVPVPPQSFLCFSDISDELLSVNMRSEAGPDKLEGLRIV